MPPRHRRRAGILSGGPLVIGVVVAVVLLVAAAGWTDTGIRLPWVGTDRSGHHYGSADQKATPIRNPYPRPSVGASARPSAVPSTAPKPSVTRPVAPPAPVIPAGNTLCGASFMATGGQSYMDAFHAEQSMIGSLHSVRVFYPGAPASWPGNAGNVGRTVIVSFKFSPGDVLSGKEDSLMRNWFATAPRDRQIYWSYWHEPEDDIANGSFSAADYRAAWAHLAGLADAAGNAKLHATLILMNWTVSSSSGRNWLDYYAGNSVIDVIGWDVYNWNFKKGTYADPGNLLDRVIAASKSVGKPWGVAELGGAKVPSDPSGTARAAWLASMVNYIQKGNALWATYFDIDWQNGAYDYRLRDAASQNVWKAFCQS